MTDGGYDREGSQATASTASEYRVDGTLESTFVEVLTEDFDYIQLGNAWTGDYTLGGDGTRTADLWSTGDRPSGSFFVTETSAGTFDRDRGGNDFTGEYDLDETSSTDYGFTLTTAGGASTLTGLGTLTATVSEGGNTIEGTFARDEWGTDGYTLNGTGADYTEEVIGTETYGVEVDGNAAEGTSTTTVTGSGTFDRTTSGVGAVYSSGSDVYDYTMTEDSDSLAGLFDRTDTGTNRYGLVQSFDDVSGTAGGEVAGHLHFLPVGRPIVDPNDSDRAIAVIGSSTWLPGRGWKDLKRINPGLAEYYSTYAGAELERLWDIHNEVYKYGIIPGTGNFNPKEGGITGYYVNPDISTERLQELAKEAAILGEKVRSVGRAYADGRAFAIGAKFGTELSPIGPVVAAVDTVVDVYNGDYKSAGVSALGAIPGSIILKKATKGAHAVAPTVAGTRPGASTYWQDKLTSFHVDQANAVLGQIDNTCGIAAVQIEALRRGKSVIGLEKEMVQALVRDSGRIQGLQVSKVYEYLQKAGRNPNRPQVRRTVEQLQTALQSGDSAIVMIAKGEGARYSTHYVVVERFTETYLPGGVRVPMVQIIDSTEGARLLVTQQEFATRFAAAVGQVIIVPK